MKTLKLTAKDFKSTDSYYKEYCGKTDVSDYEGNIEIEGGLSYVFFTKLSAKGYIIAEARTGIKAGEGIKAGTGIKAGWGIEAGLSITCKLVLSFSIKAFAGICTWRQLNDDAEKTITCGKKEGDGVVEYGILKEVGLPDEKVKDTECGDIIEVNGVKYKKL